MGIRFYCPNGHKLNVKSFQAGRRGICPFCGAKIIIPSQSTRKSGKSEHAGQGGGEQEIVLQTAPSDQQTVPSQNAFPAADAGTAIRSAPMSAPLAAAIPTATPIGQLAAAPMPGPQGAAPASAMAAQQAAPAQAGMVAIPQAQAMQPTAGMPTAATAPSTAGISAVGPPPAVAGPPDPLAEGGNVVWYVRPPSGGQFGPATSDVMRTWIAEGRVSADSLTWREGWRDWLVAGDVFPQLSPGKSEFGVNVHDESRATTGAGGGRVSLPRSRRQETIRQASMITLLVLAVGALVGVFLWVVYYSPGS